MNKRFWMPREDGCLTDGERGYDNSTRIEPKRGHQWFMDGTGTELFSNKKQAVEAHDSRPVPVISHTNVPKWNSPSSFQSLSGEFADRLFGSKPLRNVNLVDRSIPSVNGGSLNMGRRDFQDRYNHTSMGLSMSHFSDPSHFNLGGIGKIKVNQVRDSGTGLSPSMGLSYGRGDNRSVSMGTTIDKRNNNTMSPGQNNINSDKNTISMGRTFGKPDFGFFSMGHTLNKGEENCISMGYNYSRRNDSIRLMGQSFYKRDDIFISNGQFSGRGDSNVMSLSSYNKERDNFMSLGQTYDKANENFISVGSSYNKRNDNPIGMPLTYEKPDRNITPVGSTRYKGDSGVLSMGHNFNKGKTNTVPFGGYQDETKTYTSENICNGYEILMGTQNSAQASQGPSLSIGIQDSAPASQEPSLSMGTQNSASASQEPSSLVRAQNSAPSSREPNSLIGAQKSVPGLQEPISLIGAQNSAQASQEPSQPNILESNVESTVNNVPITNPGTVRAPKPKVAKKAPANSFPASVKSLLSTGMLDGIPVKYVAWTREKSLKGTIKRTGYLCGCSNCNYNKVLNAYEFERHANCKTRLPNNHIYFENGKTVYGVFQELKHTPQDLLFDAIQNVTGSEINQDNYRIWKASYQAATREFQHICANDDTVAQPSSG